MTVTVKAVRVPLGESCGKQGCTEHVVYKIELPHRLRLFCREHAVSYLELAGQVTGWTYQLDTRERERRK